jgi:hypothetical protein
VWILIPKLQSVQFPFRWLAISSMVGAVMVALSIPCWLERLRREKQEGGAWRILAITVAGAILLSFAFSAIHFATPSFYDDRQKLYAEMRTIPGAQGHRDWWPIWAEGDELRRAMEKVEVEGRSVTVTAWEAERREFQIAGGSAGEARVRAFYYPHWAASDAGGRSLPVRPAADGAILISLPADALSVTLEFREPRRVSLAAMLSALGWISIAGLLIFGLREAHGREYDALHALPDK